MVSLPQKFFPKTLRLVYNALWEVVRRTGRVKLRKFTAIDGETYVEYFDKKLGRFVLKRKRVTWLKIFAWSHAFFYFGGLILLLAGFKILGKILLWCFTFEIIGVLAMCAGYWVLRGLLKLTYNKYQNQQSRTYYIFKRIHDWMEGRHKDYLGI